MGRGIIILTKEEWNAIKNRDSSYDGGFYYGLKTAKHICRPSCAKRLPNPKNIVIFKSVREGIRKGYAPCLKCRPDLPSWQGSKVELADRAEKYLKKHYREKFSLSEMSEELFSNESYLLRVFKEVKGETLLACHNRIRCEAAQELLMRNELSVSYISDYVGYTSASHFSHVFKKLCGCTPTEWRRSYLESLND